MSIFSDDKPQTVDVHGRQLRCLVCQHTTFYRREAQLHSGIATILNTEWTGPVCECVVCAGCGYVHWFFPMKD